MKYKLKLLDRFNIINSLPKQGNYEEMKNALSIEEKLSPLPEEATSKQIDQKGDQIKWNPELDVLEEFEFDSHEVALIAETFTNMSRIGKFTKELVNLWDMFVKK